LSERGWLTAMRRSVISRGRRDINAREIGYQTNFCVTNRFIDGLVWQGRQAIGTREYEPHDFILIIESRRTRVPFNEVTTMDQLNGVIFMNRVHH